MFFMIILQVLNYWCFNDKICKLFFKKQNVHHFHFAFSYIFSCLVNLVFINENKFNSLLGLV